MAPPDPKQTELQKQIAQTWDLARQQLKRLRDQVEKTSQLANLKARTDAVNSEKDRALRNLGDAVWREVQRGLKLPPSCRPALELLQAADRKAGDQASEIADILAEGSEQADRVAPKKGRGP